MNWWCPWHSSFAIHYSALALCHRGTQTPCITKVRGCDQIPHLTPNIPLTCRARLNFNLSFIKCVEISPELFKGSVKYSGEKLEETCSAQMLLIYRSRNLLETSVIIHLSALSQSGKTLRKWMMHLFTYIMWVRIHTKYSTERERESTYRIYTLFT